MSNYLAVATVTAALGQVVHTAVQGAVSGVNVRYGRPVDQAAGSRERRVHVYMYQVTPNAAWRNADLPSRGAEGRVTRRPQAAIDLHFLITFYGDDQALEPDRMLGAVVRDLHARPSLGAQDVADAIASHAPALAGSDLAASVEGVRFTPATLTLDEQSKLWSVMLQTPHAPTLAYTASVVLLDALEQADQVLPVLRRGADDRGPVATAGSFPALGAAWIGFAGSETRQPRLPSLRAAPLGARLVLSGSNLGGDAVALSLRHGALPAQRVVIPPADRDAGELRLTLPMDAAAQVAWAAGLYGIVVEVTRGAAVSTSAAWPLPVSPRITAIAPNPAARAAGSVTLTISCQPHVLPTQRATLLLAGREIDAQPHAAATDTLQFVVDAAPALNESLVWLRVDDVESQPWRIDPATGNFAFDDTQRVVIT